MDVVLTYDNLDENISEVTEKAKKLASQVKITIEIVKENSNYFRELYLQGQKKTLQDNKVRENLEL